MRPPAAGATPRAEQAAGTEIAGRKPYFREPFDHSSNNRAYRVIDVSHRSGGAWRRGLAATAQLDPGAEPVVSAKPKKAAAWDGE